MVANSVPVKNIPNYPDEEEILAEIRSLPRHLLLDAVTIAREIGSLRSANIVLLGAGAEFIGLSEGALTRAIEELFGNRKELAEVNLEAFRRGRAAR